MIEKDFLPVLMVAKKKINPSTMNVYNMLYNLVELNNGSLVVNRLFVCVYIYLKVY